MQVVIWSKANCPQCDKAKALLNAQEIEWMEKKIGDQYGYSVEDLLAEVPGAKSVPQIFADGKHIGGYQELVKFLEGAV